MNKFLKRKPIIRDEPDLVPSISSLDENVQRKHNKGKETLEIDKDHKVMKNIQDLVVDQGLRFPILTYNTNTQDIIRRAYLKKGPFQPKMHSFPWINEGSKKHRFISAWFGEFEWLEYSILKNAAYCLFCYLFPEAKSDHAFIVDGFQRFKDKQRLKEHATSVIHNVAKIKCNSLMNEKHSIGCSLIRQGDKEKKKHHTRLNASIDLVKFLLKQGLSFSGHDESERSSQKGNFLELLSFLADHNEEIKGVVLENAPKNACMTAPEIQRDIVSVVASETIKKIVKEVQNAIFSILVDESRDVFTQEQMVVVIRFVNEKGQIIERLLGLVHVRSTTSASLMVAIMQRLAQSGLSIDQLRGKGYDGASNMKGEFNGLKALILKENSSAYYIHCFAHQLQLVIVAVAKKHKEVASLFDSISAIMNCVGGSCKRADKLKELEVERVQREPQLGYIESDSGSNQALGTKRPGDKRWGSNYYTLLNLIRMFSSVVNALSIIFDDGDDDFKGSAFIWWKHMQTFDFVFLIHLMEEILGKTNDLSLALQRKDQDIINALNLVKLSKRLLNNLRVDDRECESFLERVYLFCDKNDIGVMQMEDSYQGSVLRARRSQNEVTNLYHYRYEIFNRIIDYVLSELNDRCNERNTELLLCITSLDSSNNFANFSKEKLVHLASFYPNDLCDNDVWLLRYQLDHYIMDLRDEQKLQLKGICELAKVFIEQGKEKSYFLVYRLIKLAILLPVATASVERVFSAMKIIKNRLRNKLGDHFMNDCLVAYIENDISSKIENEVIMGQFQNMQPRRQSLP